jgi:hypothetical protein
LYKRIVKQGNFTAFFFFFFFFERLARRRVEIPQITQG